MLSGPDGVGKSTIIEIIQQREIGNTNNLEKIWMRHQHYFAKAVNMFGRILKKSYRDHHDWGEIGYHDYEGIFGVIYIFAIYLDHLIFRAFLKPHKIKKSKTYILDRYILDVVADLIVDTQNDKFVFFLFDKVVRGELENFDAFILECDKDIVVTRRADIKDDKKYIEKVNAYNKISARYSIAKLNTGRYSANEISQKIFQP